MGVSRYDKSAQHKRLEQRYALDDKDGVRALLRDIHTLNSRSYNGDYAACDILADLATAIGAAGLTDRQREALGYIYGEDLTQADAGKRMGVSHAAVSQFIEAGTQKIAEIYFHWAGHGEGYESGEDDSQ
ncbi:sigma factor-like helix-turn-helix DNA-binding protein [Alteribacter populi]|uniref:sigma factor-like helix-turn-helix DNA-binding protein n=1 Tax=Alteribacter populi TaxID=2011011 RepID=UPI000BBB266F|nr:sigma factor-like helix-turn-helix DNA-binding protein [Alteribacter populi]